MKLIKILFVVLLSWIFIKLIWMYNDSQKELILRHKVVCTGLITKIDFFPKGDGLFVEYEFNWKGKLIKGKKRVFISSNHLNKAEQIVKNKFLPVLCDSNDVFNNELPITTSDFTELKFNRPDSLIKTYLLIDSLIALH